MDTPLKLYRITYVRNWATNTVRMVEAKGRMEAITSSMPEEKIDEVKIEYMCEVDEIVNRTSASGK